MLLSNSARLLSRRVIQTANRRTASTNAFRSNEENFRKALPYYASAATAAAALVAVGTIQNSQSNVTANEASSVQEAVKAVEDRFAVYWPRNIIILFGPPVSTYLMEFISFLIILILVGSWKRNSCSKNRRYAWNSTIIHWRYVKSSR